MSEHRNILVEKIQQIRPSDFEEIALQVFDYQSVKNPIYKKYLSLLGVHPGSVSTLQGIPFLPISFFKTHQIITGNPDAHSVLFSSSGTTETTTSRHFIKDLAFYKKNTVRGFESFYGKVADYCILGLLPAYLERSGSSLIAMVDHFIQLSRYPQSGFFLYNHEELAAVLANCKSQKIPTLLIGVSFALLDFAERYPIDLQDVIIMETGGMKGRRKEITRTELHRLLKNAFNVNSIHSEYGMTELLSQAYSKGEGIFTPAPTMKVLSREITDPFAIQKMGKTGVLNIIDLANMDSCAFIATDDLGRTYENGTFELLGRLDHSDIRGCNLMVI